MKITEIEYSRLFNLRDYNNERITLRAVIDENEDEKAMYKLYIKVLELNKKFQTHRDILESISIKQSELKSRYKELKQADVSKDRRKACRLMDIEEEIDMQKQRIKEIEKEIEQLHSVLEVLRKVKEEIEVELRGEN